MAVRYSLPPLSESDTQPAAEPPPPYGHALMGVRVLKFDSGSAAEGCSMAPYIY